MPGIRERFARLGDNLPAWGGRLSVFVALLGFYLLVTVILGLLWSRTPAAFDVREQARTLAAADDREVTTGSVTTAALIGVMETLLEKPGGYLHNDRLPPGVWLDNLPAWEYGALVQSRDLARAMRESFSRSQSQSTEDKDLALAEPRFHFTADNWILPSAEGEYRDAIAHTRSYLRRLEGGDTPNAQFYARADNLRYWLSNVDSRLGSLSQRLSASVGQRRLITELAGDENAGPSTPAPVEVEVRTPWTKIDDVFFEARGSAWALLHFLRAVEVDFADILDRKGASVSLRQIIRELEGTQQPVRSPMILNGHGMGVLANHSLVMASYISRANAAIIDLRDLLSQG